MLEQGFPHDPRRLRAIYDSPAFERDYGYDGPLGVVYSSAHTVFFLWSPTAGEVSLLLYTSGQGGSPYARHVMERAEKGVWSLRVDGDLHGRYYTYAVTNFGRTVEIVDPYARSVGCNGQRGMVLDLMRAAPANWEKDSFARPASPADAVVWEVSVDDFSSDPLSGVRPEWRGKYLAFTEEATSLESKGVFPTCTAYLRELGITHVQLLPIFDFARVDEADAHSAYNWGYDPQNYFSPEGSYATNAFDGAVRVRECRAMVAALHRAGLGVVMDVVYNHTFTAQGSCLHGAVPYYYHRVADDGSFADGSACGNEIASERKMVRRYLLDAVAYWAEAYHIDGFRFDLMGLTDTETMNAVRKRLDILPYGDRILLYGEPWYAASPALRRGLLPASKPNLGRLKPSIAAFSDHIRDTVKGNVFIHEDKGFVNGGTGLERALIDALRGYDSEGAAVSQIVSYVSAHDNLTLWDKLLATAGRCDYDTCDEELLVRNRMAAVLYLLSPGMPFMQAGEEFARTKLGDDNSYRSPRNVNRLDWGRAAAFRELTAYYRGLFRIRAAFPALRRFSAAPSRVFSEIQDGTVAFTLCDGNSPERMLAVCCHAGEAPVRVRLRTGGGVRPSTWNVLADEKRAGLEVLTVETGKEVELPPLSLRILVASEVQ